MDIKESVIRNENIGIAETIVHREYFMQMLAVLIRFRQFQQRLGEVRAYC